MARSGESYDAVIVGAGPAGLAAAIVLARNGWHVLVCAGQPLPIDKPCGEGILPTGVGLLRRLDVLKHLDPDQMHPFKGIRIRTSSGQTAEAPFLEGPGLGIRRLNLSQALVRSARQWPNLEIRETVVRGVCPGPRAMEVQFHDGMVRARLVIGADGLNSRVRRWAGLEGGLGRYRRLGMRRHFHLPPWSEYVEVLHGPGIEAYVTPCGPGLTGVAFLWEAARNPQLRGGFAALLRAFPDLQRRLEGIRPASAPLGKGPLHRRALGQCSDGMLLIGDAAGYLDACTGEGISLALAQALALEDCLAPLLRRSTGTITRQQLGAYERSFRDIVRPYVIATHLLLFLKRHPAWFDRIVITMHDNPDLLQWLFSAQMGQASFWPDRSDLFRLVRGFVAARRRTTKSHAP